MTLPHLEINPGEFEPERHYYPRALNAVLHPMARNFMNLGNERIAERFHHLHPETNEAAIYEALGYESNHFFWGGSDLILTTNELGERHLVLIETNSCASGQKSLPQASFDQDAIGYEKVIKNAFLPRLKRRPKSHGRLAVIYDKNLMEASGYAATIADLTGEAVILVPFENNDPDPKVRIDSEQWIEAKTPGGEWVRLRGAMRYLTQKPWNRIPPLTKTLLANPILACLAGGRNKMLAAKSYDFLNADWHDKGLLIRTPETIWDVGKEEVPIWIDKMGGLAVIKVPYSNAGRGVYTITSPGELDEFMAVEHEYDRFIVQALIGNFNWSSRGKQGRLFHVGTVPNKKLKIFVSDLRFIVVSGKNGFQPVAIYARKARMPLPKEVPEQNSWDILGTNLSNYHEQANNWSTDTDRLLLVDNKDFNQLGVGTDDLIQAYMQTVLSIIAIDKLAQSLVSKKGTFRTKLFRSLNPDPSLYNEIMK